VKVHGSRPGAPAAVRRLPGLLRTCCLVPHTRQLRARLRARLQDMLWVWADASPSAAAEAAATPPVLVEELRPQQGSDDPGAATHVSVREWYMRDMPL